MAVKKRVVELPADESSKITGKRPTKGREPISMDDIFESTEKKVPVKKSSVPILKVTEDLSKKADKLIELQQTIDSATSEFAAVKKEVIDAVGPMRENICAHEGYISSVKVPTTNGADGVTATWVGKYTGVAYEKREDIRKIIGERVDEFFEVSSTVVMKADAMDKLMEFVKSIGIDKFKEFFETKRSLVPKEKYTTEFFTTFTVGEQADLRELVKQYEPSLKAK